jgi:hypothetical protein
MEKCNILIKYFLFYSCPKGVKKASEVLILKSLAGFSHPTDKQNPQSVVLQLVAGEFTPFLFEAALFGVVALDLHNEND